MRDRGYRLRLCLAAATIVAIPALAVAAETITYSYDAKGRLVKVVRTKDNQAPVTTQYSHDKANNRTNVTVTGSTNTPPPS